MTYTWNFDIVSQAWDILLLGLAEFRPLTAASFVLGLPLRVSASRSRVCHGASSRPGWLRPISTLQSDSVASAALLVLFRPAATAPALILSRSPPRSSRSRVVLGLRRRGVRAGISSLDRGQWDGARAVGMSYSNTLRRIILPQAVKRMVPVFLERLIELFKTSTIASVISFPELLYVAQDLAARSYRPLEVFSVVALMFMVTLIVLSQISRLIELRLARVAKRRRAELCNTPCSSRKYCALGALGTIQIAFVALLISLPIGLVVGAGRYSRLKFVPLAGHGVR